MKSNVADQTLAELAIEAANVSYSPYSRFRVGAALSTTGGVFQGANIENRSYGLTVCAERVAVFKALSKGETRFTALAVASPTDEFITPCGACLQVLSEFCPDLKVLLVQKEGKVSRTSLKKLYPKPFKRRK
jgi:cytidine deaminase